MPDRTYDLSRLQFRAHDTAVRKGFWDGYPDKKARGMGEQIALMHSELSEALEGDRHGNPPDEHCPEHCNVEIEFADCVIRILDTCEANGWDLCAAINAKMAYNEGRPHKHGKRF